ncbi:MAG TPA: hypothetical protein VHY79_01870 [Rhizomicrobium sp.]|jgi:hypothetical protein|nr:hypothetical protein [Rhizomicrobium sp.]
MKSIQTALLAGVGALLLSGAISVATAAGHGAHVMTVRLPGGVVEHIRYSGDVPPQVEVSPWAGSFDVGWPVAFFGPSPFAEMDRISAAMDRQMATMLQNADAIAANPGLVEIGAGKLPPGSESYSFVSTASGSGVCARSVQIMSRGGGQKPQIVSKTYGDCGNGHGGVSSGVGHAAPADQPSDVREIRYTPRAAPDGGMIREASAVQH